MKRRSVRGPIETALIVLVAMTTCGSGSCLKKKDDSEPEPPVCRTITEARVESARILRAPTICDGESACHADKASGGFTCADNRGGLVTCSPDKAYKCQQNAGEAEIGPVVHDAGVPRD